MDNLNQSDIAYNLTTEMLKKVPDQYQYCINNMSYFGSPISNLNFSA